VELLDLFTESEDVEIQPVIHRINNTPKEKYLDLAIKFTEELENKGKELESEVSDFFEKI